MKEKILWGFLWAVLAVPVVLTLATLTIITYINFRDVVRLL